MFGIKMPWTRKREKREKREAEQKEVAARERRRLIDIKLAKIKEDAKIKDMDLPRAMKGLRRLAYEYPGVRVFIREDCPPNGYHVPHRSDDAGHTLTPHGGTYDGGGASGDWSSSPCDSSSSSSSSDSGSSSDSSSCSSSD